MASIQSNETLNVSGRIGAIADTWDIVVLVRRDGPPLRFRGQRVAHQKRRLTEDCEVFVDVWSRKKGDYVVAHSDIRHGTMKTVAQVVDDLDDVAYYLEQCCKFAPTTLQVTDAAVAMANLIKSIALQQNFALLVGDFLGSLVTHRKRQRRL